MRNARLWRTAALLWALSGLAAGAGAFLLPGPTAPEWARASLVAYALTAVIFGLASALWSHAALRAGQALRNDDEVLARWRVDAATWRRFVARNAELNQAPGALGNELSIRDAVPDAGVEVVVGREAVEIDGSIHPLPLRGPPEVTEAFLVQDAPDYVELQLRYPAGGGGASGVSRAPTCSALRFPVAPASWRDARAIVAHFNRLTPQKPDFFHGKGDGSDPEDLNTCISCGFQYYKYASTCPRCGGGMMTRRWARRLGWPLVACGLFITAVIGAVIFYTAPLLLHPGRTIDGSRFTGDRATAVAILGIFAVVLAFGLTATAYGAWQVKTGKRDRRVMTAMLVLWTILIAVAYVL